MQLESNDPDIDEPETTIAVAFISSNQLTVGWVGDSRAYVINGESEEKLTVDDSWIEMVVQTGEYTREQAESHANAHCVIQVLGMLNKAIEVHVVQKTVAKGDLVLLSTDGLWNYLHKQGDIASMLNCCGLQDSISMCKHLVDHAIAQGGHDNITVAIAVI